jgi:hypothetical protein
MTRGLWLADYLRARGHVARDGVFRIEAEVDADGPAHPLWLRVWTTDQARDLAARLTAWADSRDRFLATVPHGHCSACDREVLLDAGLWRDEFQSDTCRQKGELRPHVLY